VAWMIGGAKNAPLNAAWMVGGTTSACHRRLRTAPTVPITKRPQKSP
jgi:hypothetical protein